MRIDYEADGEVRSLPAATEPLPENALRAGGRAGSLGFFIAFLPDGIDASQARALALDEQGAELGSADW